MNILLIQPGRSPFVGLQHLGLTEPLGLEMIGGALADHRVLILDLRLEPAALASTIAGFRPQMVGISSSFTVGAQQTLVTAMAVKAIDPKVFVVVGGHHPSLRPSDFAHPAIDAIVVGEGEVTVRELVDCLVAKSDTKKVAGLVLNSEGRQYHTGHRPLLSSLDTLPFPSRDLTRSYRLQYYLTLTRPIASLETTRGCPYRCSFCSVWRFYEGQVRSKSPERVVAELRAVEEPHVLFTDDNFLANASRALHLARLIRKEGIRKKYDIQARSDTIVRHPEVISEWRQVGLSGVFIGFEKPDQVGLETINKHNSPENNEQALAILRGHGIEPTASFIVDPDYTREDFAALRDYVRRLKLKVPDFAVLTPLPGTELFEEMKQRLATMRYELFDLAHAVVPTRLPLPEFYRELAGLWRAAYPRWKLDILGAYMWVRDLWQQYPGSPHWKRVLEEARRLGNPQAYMQDWITVAQSSTAATGCR